MKLDKEKLSRTPIIGRLVYCTVEDHALTLKELSITLLFSLIPILIVVLIDYFISVSYHSGLFKDSIINQLKNGELFLYSTAFLSPVLWNIIGKWEDNEKTFPHKLSHIIIFILLWFICVVFFTYERLRQAFSGELVVTGSLITTSIIVFAFTIALIYLVTVYNNNMLDASQKFLESEKDFKEQVKLRRGE